MTPHEKAIDLISNLGIAPKKIAEIIGKSQSVVYDKIKNYRSNEFLEEDYNKIKTYIVKYTKDLI